VEWADLDFRGQPSLFGKLFVLLVAQAVAVTNMLAAVAVQGDYYCYSKFFNRNGIHNYNWWWRRSSSSTSVGNRIKYGYFNYCHGIGGRWWRWNIHFSRCSGRQVGLAVAVLILPLAASGTAGQGNAGGTAFRSGAYDAAGGGGGSAVGALETLAEVVAAGGAGTSNSLSGAAVTYAGGGGGGTANTTSGGAGGAGGGGAGDA
jgi:hypothetical protein